MVVDVMDRFVASLMHPVTSRRAMAAMLDDGPVPLGRL